MGDIPKFDTTLLQQLTMADLHARYKELIGAFSESNNRKFIERKIAYRMQEIESGKLNEDIQSKIQELIDSYDPVNKTNKKSKLNDSEVNRDGRLPIPGSFISKIYKGKRIEVKVLEDGFEYQSVIYKNLSAVAKTITGSHWNGFIFFGFKRP